MYVLIMENVAIRAKITEIFHINPIKFVYECIIRTNIVLYNKVCIINLCIFINCWHTILKSKDFSHWFLHKSFIFHPIEILILSKKSTTSHLQLLYNDLHYNQLQIHYLPSSLRPHANITLAAQSFCARANQTDHEFALTALSGE